jgi:hypothetical protein
MNAFEKYGLDIMGINNTQQANNLLIKLTIDVFGSQSEMAFKVLNSCLDELYSKASSLTDRCYGSYNLFTIEMGHLTDNRNKLFKKLCIEFLPLTSFTCTFNESTSSLMYNKETKQRSSV